jgi:adhesin transport system membrane fusion protein
MAETASTPETEPPKDPAPAVGPAAPLYPLVETGDEVVPRIIAETKEATDKIIAEKSEQDQKLEYLIEHPPLPSHRWIAYTIMAIVGTLVALGFFTQLDEVTVAEGKVVPMGEVKVVQHLEGGVIKEISVHEGDIVAEGQTLLLLDVSAANLSQDEIEVQYFQQLAIRARLEAEASGKDPVWPEDVMQKRPQLVETQRSQYNVRKEELNSTLNVLRSVLAQREQEVKDLNGKLQANVRNLQLARERLASSNDLLKKSLVSRADNLKTQGDVTDLEQTNNQLKGGIISAEAAIREAAGRIPEKLDAFRREARTDLAKADEAAAKLREQLTATSEKSARLEIKSPIPGVVNNMRYQTVGGVVKAGEPILEIVPIGEKLVVTAKLNPIDRGFVTEGMRASVKLSTYDFVRYGSLDGRVARIAADATMDQEKGTPFFDIEVETPKNYLGKKEGELPITPGMVATVDIHTGHKTAIDFLIKPVIKMKTESFEDSVRERVSNDNSRITRPLIH